VRWFRRVQSLAALLGHPPTARGRGRKHFIGAHESRSRFGLIAGLLGLLSVASRPVVAQEWYDLYADGVAALRSGQAQRAVGLLQRAIQKRPTPGTGVPTYGTNFEPRYFPYLRLAEAHLKLEAYEDARKVLETSARLGVEPAEERAALVAKVSAALEAKRPPPDPTPAPPAAVLPIPAPPVVLPPPPAEGRAAEAVREAHEHQPAPPTTLPPAVPPTTTSTLASRPGRGTDPRPAGPASSPPPRDVRSSALDIKSDPPGAQVFLDDEAVGRTDPVTGRLRLTGLASGRHRIRLSAENRDDLIREVDLAGDTLRLEGVLPQGAAAPGTASATSSLPSGTHLPIGLSAGLILLVALALGLWWRSFSRKPAVSVDRLSTPTRVRSDGDQGTDEGLPVAFGDYLLVRRIGKGGMAAVYEATRRGERFALKRPLAGFLDDPLFLERFQREAELGRTLHHPNIVRIYDRGRVGETPYFAMELIPGETLRARLDRDGALESMHAARVTARVAEALDYAHNKGVIHRDLKPSNIMLLPEGDVKVMDYGIARAQRLEGLTTTGSFLGTPYYAAPETVDGSAGPSSDLYSLGVVFFEMLTGTLPFKGDTSFAVLRSHCDTPPPVPSSLKYNLPAALDRIVLRLLAKEPKDRPTAEHLLNELADFLRERR
jgi:hypothetical protein